MAVIESSIPAQQLRSQLAGQVITPESGGYEEACTIWNAMIERRPAVIARCAGVSDVIACVKFAREHGIPLAIRGGGHNISGLSLCDDGLVIDLSLMRGVWVDPGGHRAIAQGGCLLGDVDRETQVHGLAAVLGFVSQTGIAGLTLGGGFGYLTRRFGWSSDNVRGIGVVTAEGRTVHASESENSDLFWGLRGGGGNFGVATSFEYQLYPVGPDIVGGAIAWPIEAAESVLALYQQMVETAPPEFACVLGLRLAPAAPWLSPKIHGRPIIALFICHTGALREAELQVEPIKRFGQNVGDIVQRRTYVSQQSLLDATQPKGRRYYWKSEYLPKVSSEFLEVFLECGREFVSPNSALLVFPLNGALNRLPQDHSAVGNRDARAVLNIASSWDRPEHDAANMDWARSAWSKLRRFSTGGTYINFLTEEEGEDRIRAAYGANHARLGEIKREWDPYNLFRLNKNIAP